MSSEPSPPTPVTATLGTPFHGAEPTESVTTIASTLRTTKRKLDDAFQSLDNAVASSEPQRPTPPKRTHTIRSLYSTLAKYGIKGKETQQESSHAPIEASPTTSKSTPHLSAILARAATRTRKALPFKFSSSTPPLPPTADYRPSSLPAFLARLSTFKLSTYANKPSVIDAVAASKCGWINDGKDRLVCGLCRSSWVVAGRDRMNKDAANALLEKQRVSLVDAHKDGCPWKTRQCDSTIYCILLQSPATMVSEIKASAMALDPWVRNIEMKHPLTSTQLSSLQSTLSAVTIPSDTPQPQPSSNSNTPYPDQDDGDVFISSEEQAVGLSDTAILASLFGWTLAPATPPDSTRRAPLGRANSTLSSPSTPRVSLSRSSSIRPTSPTRLSSSSVQQGTPATPSHAPSSQFTFRMPSSVSTVNSKRDTILQCALCQRRLGLWAFSPESPASVTEPCPVSRRSSTDTDITMESTAESGSTNHESTPATPVKMASTRRPFDVLKEHRAYCPYVVRSTIVPTLPAPPTFNRTGSSNTLPRSSSSSALNNQNSVLEGWRAVLTVVLRYGAGQRQRLGLDFVERLRGENASEPAEVDGVKAIIAGVKRRGGKDLLQYVKGLLG
ncbi:hypothetical protein DXG01_012768 [Tephrocybe rancida]|nr:hypothetical protein DXG01_012768 [Tephrocybe rancida]